MKQPTSPAEAANRLHYLREEIRDLEAQVRALKSEKAKIEYELVEIFRSDAQGTDQVRTDIVTASLKHVTIGKKRDEHKFLMWVLKSRNIQLLEPRISQLGFREYYGKKEIVPPGLELFDKYTISLTNR